MSILKFNKGRTGASGKHVDYIMRESACHDVSFHNVDELKSENEYEAKINARSYAYAQEDIERSINEKGVTHYRMVLSFDRQEDTEQAREQAHKFLQENFKDARAIVAIHQDTEHTHAHVWLDARQTNEKKIHLNPTQYKSLDEKWAKQYDREYGTEYAKDYKAKKEQTRQFKREMAEQKREGKQEQPPNKPPRASDRLNNDFYREKEAKDLGVERNDQTRAGASERPFEVRNSEVEKTDREIEQRESAVKQQVTGLAQGIDEYRQQVERGSQELDRASAQLDRAELESRGQSEKVAQISERIDGLHQERTNNKEIEKERDDYER
jgi:hypothetical protein